MRVHVTLVWLAACTGIPGAGPQDANVGPQGIDSDLLPGDGIPPGAIFANGTAFEDGLPYAGGSSIPNAPIAGVQLCSSGLVTNPCTTTDLDGHYYFVLDGLLGSDDVPFLLTATASGHLKTSGLGYSSTHLGGWYINYPVELAMFDDARAGAFFSAAGFTYPPVASGFVRVVVSEQLIPQTVEGATVTLTSGSATNAAVYLDVGSDGREVPNRTLTATGSNGGALFGNVEPGDFSITVTVSGQICTGNGFSWPGSDGASASGHLDSGAFTDNVRVFCR